MQKNLKADSKMTNKNPYALILIKAYGFICYVNFTGSGCCSIPVFDVRNKFRLSKNKTCVQEKPKRRRLYLLFYVCACATWMQTQFARRHL